MFNKINSYEKVGKPEIYLTLGLFGAWLLSIVLIFLLKTLYLQGMIVLCYSFLYLSLGSICSKFRRRWKIFMMLNQLGTAFLIQEMILNYLLSETLVLQTFLIVLISSLNIQFQTEENNLPDQIINSISLLFCYLRQLSLNLEDNSIGVLTVTALQFIIGIGITQSQRWLRIVSYEELEMKYMKQKMKSSTFREVLTNQLPPFFWLKQNFSKSETSVPENRFLIPELGMKIGLKGTNNQQVFRDEDRIEDIYLHETKEQITLSLLQHLKKFRDQLIINQTVRYTDQYTIEECQLRFFSKESSHQISDGDSISNLPLKESYYVGNKENNYLKKKILDRETQDNKLESSHQHQRSNQANLVLERFKRFNSLYSRQPVKEPVAQKPLTYQIQEINENITKRNDKIYTVKINAIFENGRWSIIVMFQESMTQYYENKIQDLIRQDQNKDDLLASVSHDFKTPINGMFGLVDAVIKSLQENDSEKPKHTTSIAAIGDRQPHDKLRFHDLDDKSAGQGEKKSIKSQTQNQNVYYLEIIRKNILLLLYMISDIQDYAKVQKGELKVIPCTFNINSIVHEVIELMSIQAEQKKIEIRHLINVGSSGEMRSDPNRIKQILFNLVSNALKFTLRGYIMIKVIQEVNNLVKISVSDTGIGIPEQVQTKLFKLYSTFDQKGLNKNGVGLGLVICKNLVSLLGPNAKIRLESTQNVGTTFSFKIFMKLPEDNPKANTHVQFKQEDYLKQSMHSSSIYIFSKRNIPSNPLFQIESSGFINPFDTHKASITEEQLEDSTDQTVGRNITTHQMEIKKRQTQTNLGQSFTEVRLIQKIVSILVVDDEPFNVIAIKVMCKYDPMIQIDEAYNGQEAIIKVLKISLQKIKQCADSGKLFDYIFLDLTMPIMNGYETALAIRQWVKFLKNNKVDMEQIRKPYMVAISGYDDSRERDYCHELGFDAFIPKPVTLPMIQQIIIK